MIELVVPDTANGGAPADDRLTRTRELVGRDVYTFDGPLEEALTLAEDVSRKTHGSPVLVNDVRTRGEDTRTVDVYMHRDGQRMSVSKDVERPQPN